jgi:VIT1/CCC1 family predicted Fe2+/Mn2+ transporter
MNQNDTQNDVQTDHSVKKVQADQQSFDEEIQNSSSKGKQNQNQNQNQNAQHSASVFQRIKQSLYDSIGNIVFGMEDGTVSIFGLVFGLANTANNSHSVLLGGATGAAAAAVSMMAGTYLDVQSTKAKAQSEIDREKQEIQNKPKEEEKEIRNRLQGAKFSDQEINQIVSVLKGKPGAMLKFESAYELQIGQAMNENAIVQSIWMFLADLIAASIPVIPFAFFSLGTARIWSLIITGALVLVLGVARALITKSNVMATVIETLLIAGAAGAVGVLIGKLIGGGGA